MKLPQIVVISVCLLALTVVSAHAEDASFGIEAGVTASRFSPSADGESMTLGPGAIAGIFGVLPLSKSVSLMPELVYVVKHGNRAGTTLGNPTVDYVELPILVKMPFYLHTYISEGVAFAWPVNVSGWPAAQGLTNTTSPDITEVLGGGFNFGKHAAIEFRWESGFRRISTLDTAPVQHARSFMLMVKAHR